MSNIKFTICAIVNMKDFNINDVGISMVCVICG